MTFDEILAQIIELLQRQGRVSYGALKRRFDLDDDYLNDLKDELFTCIQCEMTTGGVSSGLATWQADRQLPLNLLRHHNRPRCRHSHPLRLHLSLLHLLLTLNVGNSR